MSTEKQLPRVTTSVTANAVMNLVLGELKTPAEVATHLQISQSQVYRHMDTLRDDIINHLKDERQHALADHCGKLFEMEKEALGQYMGAENSQIKLKWFDARRTVLSDIAKVAGWGGQRHQAVMFEDAEGNRVGVVLPDYAS